MNQVSWLIYFSDVSGNLSALLSFLGLCVLIIAVAYFVASMISESMIDRWDTSSEQQEQLVRSRKMRRWFPALVGLTFTMWVVAAFMPSQQTVLAIAASEFGEQLLHTKTVNLAEQALNAWLERQIHPAPADTPK